MTVLVTNSNQAIFLRDFYSKFKFSITLHIDTYDTYDTSHVYSTKNYDDRENESVLMSDSALL